MQNANATSLTFVFLFLSFARGKIFEKERLVIEVF